MIRYCILGATGYIGKYLFHRMKEDGENVIGSSRIEQLPFFKYDVLNNDYCPIEFVEYKGKKAVIICFAQTKIDLCKRDFANSYKINVIKTLNLIDKLRNDGCKVVVFSSDNVFGDNKGDYTEEDKLCPLNEYGKMKAELEIKIQQYYPDTIILRLPKVVGTGLEGSNILTQYIYKLKHNEIEYAIKDTWMSIVCQEDIYQIIKLAIKNDLQGVYNVCCDKSYSRADLANIFFLKVGTEKIAIEKELQEFGFEDNRPIKLNMSNQKIKCKTNYHFQNYEDIVDNFIRENRMTLRFD